MHLRRPHFLALLSVSALLVALACHETTAPPKALALDSPSFDLTKTQVNKLELDNVCGNKFSVRNPTADTIALTWRVAKSNDSGSFVVPLKPADKAYGEAFFTTRDTGKVKLFYQGKKIDKEKEGRAPPCPFHLSSYVGDGVNPESWPADTARATSGGSIGYAFTAASGYGGLEVFVDGAPAPLAGTVAMAANHWMVVSAKPVVTLDADETELAGKLRGVITASDAKAAYTDYLNTSARLAQLWGATAATHEARAQSVAIDPVADSANLRRADLALAGSYHDIDAQGNAAAASRGTAGVKRFEAKRSDVIFVPVDTMEETSVVYVNGIFNGPNMANVSGTRLAAALASFVSLSPRIHARTLYNPSIPWQHQGRSRVVERCNEQVRTDARLRQIILPERSFANWIACAASGFTRYLHESFDLNEALRLQDSLLANSNTVGLSDPVVQSLADVVEQTIRGGSHVILVGHSEGSIISQLITQALRGRGTYTPDVTPRCLGIVSVAGLTTANWPLSDRYSRFVVAKGDIVTLPPGTNGKPTTETDETRKADAYVARARSLSSDDPSNSALSGIARLAAVWKGVQLHDLTEHYLTAPELVAQIRSDVVGLYQTCAVGTIQLIPSGMTLQLTGAAGFASKILALDGNQLVSADTLTWTSGNPSLARVDSHGFVTAGFTPGSTVASLSVRRRIGTGGVTIVDDSASHFYVPPTVSVETHTTTTTNEFRHITCQHLFYTIHATAMEGATIGIVVFSLREQETLVTFGFPADLDEEHEVEHSCTENGEPASFSAAKLDSWYMVRVTDSHGLTTQKIGGF